MWPVLRQRLPPLFARSLALATFGTASRSRVVRVVLVGQGLSFLRTYMPAHQAPHRVVAVRIRLEVRRLRAGTSPRTSHADRLGTPKLLAPSATWQRKRLSHSRYISLQFGDSPRPSCGCVPGAAVQTRQPGRGPRLF